MLLRKCDNKDIDAILQLQKDIFDELPGGDVILRRNSREMFESCLQKRSITLGWFDGEELAGVAILADVEGTEEDLVPGLVNIKARNAANAKLIMIRKNYYGRGFQNVSLWILEKLAYNAGFEYLCSTVSPENPYSRDNLLGFGYEYDHSAKKYNGLIRDIMVKKIEVGEYYRKLGEWAKQNEGEDAALLNAFSVNSMYMGTLDICSGGDLLEYRRGTESLRALVTGDGKILAPDEAGRLEIRDLSETVNGSSLENVWLNISRNII